MLRDRARDAARFLRTNKVCTARRLTGKCDHPGCQSAVDAANAVEDLLEAYVEMKDEFDWLKDRSAA